MRRGTPVLTALRALLLASWAVFLLAPLYWVAVTSIKQPGDYMTSPPVWFPDVPTLGHFTAALFAYRGLQSILNSALISLLATALTVLIATPMAYAFARLGTGGRHLFMWVISQRFLPPVAVVLPVFLLFRQWGLHDTRGGLALFYAMAGLPVAVWLTFAAFRQMPAALEDAARVDGCTRWTAFLRIAVPLAGPGIVAAALFTFIFTWTEFFFALILTGRTAYTLPTVFRSFLGFQAGQYGESSALAVISLVPSLLLGALVQRFFVRGRLAGGLQGT